MAVDFLYYVRTGNIEKIVVSEEGCAGVLQPAVALVEVGLAQALALNEGAHGAVEKDYAVAQKPFEF